MNRLVLKFGGTSVADIDRIRDLEDPVIYPVVPDAHNRHIADSFALAAGGAPTAEDRA